MPYLSKAERERVRWMTLADAISQIRKVESCEREEAWIQLRKAISDGGVAVRWANVSLEMSKVRPGEYVDEDDVPPTSKWFWATAWVRFSGGGRILEDPRQRPKSVQRKLLESGLLTFRRLIVLRTAVEAHWPVASTTAAHGETEDPRSESTSGTSKPSARTSGRPSAKGVVWSTLSQMQVEGFQMGRPQKALAVEIARRNNTQIGDRGWSERTLVTHISVWLAKRSSSPRDIGLRR